MNNLRTNKTADSNSKNSTRLVVTGKRVEGTWVMESTLPVKVRRSDLNDAVIVADNRRVRTLH